MIRRLGEGIAVAFRARRSTLALALPGAVLWLLFLVTSLRGIDFGAAPRRTRAEAGERGCRNGEQVKGELPGGRES